MGCGSCASRAADGGGGCGPTGCGSKGGCASGGCNRLNVFDWLGQMAPPSGVEAFNIVEIRFKGGRKEFYRNRQQFPLETGDPVVVEVTGGGWHVGYVSLRGELVRLQMRKKKVDAGPDVRPIQRRATEEDVERLQTAQRQEADALFRARTVAGALRLQMKVSDVEVQADASRTTFYYSAEDRVDFRDLVKRLADDLKTRVEMRQISLRHEAGRIGGIGSCGRELCCSTWLTDFKTVSTTAARYQQLSLNPAKLAGQCGRLKCCLNYELDTYLDALRDIPSVNRPLLTAHGEAFLQKTDIFRRLMWFGYKGDNEWHRLPVARVREIQEMNRRGEMPDVLVVALAPEEVIAPEVAIVEGSLERLDNKFKETKKKKRKKKDRDQGPDDDASHKALKPPKAEKPPRTARPAKADRPDRPDRPDQPTRPDRPPTSLPKAERGEQAGRGERDGRNLRPARPPRDDRGERGRPATERPATARPGSPPDTGADLPAEGSEGSESSAARIGRRRGGRGRNRNSSGGAAGDGPGNTGGNPGGNPGGASAPAA